MNKIIKTTKKECQISQCIYIFFFFRKLVSLSLLSKNIKNGKIAIKYQILKTTSNIYPNIIIKKQKTPIGVFCFFIFR
jgi:hypothetical protein